MEVIARTLDGLLGSKFNSSNLDLCLRVSFIAWFLLARSEKGEATREARGAQQKFHCYFIINFDIRKFCYFHENLPVPVLLAKSQNIFILFQPANPIPIMRRQGEENDLYYLKNSLIGKRFFKTLISSRNLFKYLMNLQLHSFESCFMLVVR